MSAVYHRKAWDALFAQHYQVVLDWFDANPGQSLDNCATALGIPYPVVFAAAQAAGLVILPATSAEIQWHMRRS